jgi:hypothetical protein
MNVKSQSPSSQRQNFQTLIYSDSLLQLEQNEKETASIHQIQDSCQFSQIDIHFHQNQNHNALLNFNSFTINFLQTLAEQFPIVLRLFFTDYLRSSNCSPLIKSSISNQEIIRSKHEKLILLIKKFSSVFCSFVNENIIASLILQVYEKYIVKVPNQKKIRIYNFITLYSEASIFFGTNSPLVFIQNEVKILQTKL